MRTSRQAEEAATAPHINAFCAASQSLTMRDQTRPGERVLKRLLLFVAETKNKDLGLKGELLVVEREMLFLAENDWTDLARKVRHVSVVEGDGAGYDIESFTLAGETKYIEVKTTRGSVAASFFIRANEVEFAKRHRDNFYLYRVYEYEDSRNSGMFYVCTGDLEDMFELTPTQYRAVRS